MYILMCCAHRTAAEQLFFEFDFSNKIVLGEKKRKKNGVSLSIVNIQLRQYKLVKKAKMHLKIIILKYVVLSSNLKLFCHY